MASSLLSPPTFSIEYSGPPPGVLLAGFASVGLAGLTALDYLVERLDWPEAGHANVSGMPSVTPFENGRPRHHTRIFAEDTADTAALIGELLIPVHAALPFAASIVDWAIDTDLDEIAIAAGIPIPHGPHAHRTFYVATDDDVADRFESGGIEPLGGGFLDGIKAEVLELAIERDLGVGVLITPVHYQFPDIGAALRLLEAMSAIYALDVDTDPLKEYAEAEQRYFAELSETLEAAHDRDHPADRMYM